MNRYLSRGSRRRFPRAAATGPRAPAAWLPARPDESLQLRAAVDRSAVRAGTRREDPPPASESRLHTRQSGSAIASWLVRSPLSGHIVLYITISLGESRASPQKINTAVFADPSLETRRGCRRPGLTPMRSLVWPRK